jgi:hypothetical protein
MAISLADLKAQCNVTGATEDAILTRKLAAATAFIERQLGYTLDDEEQLPDGAPADLEEAILMFAAHLYENRESTLVGVSAMVLPMGVGDIVANYRRYTFAHVEEVPDDE